MHFSRNGEGRLAKRTFGGHTVHFGEASAFRAVFEAGRSLAMNQELLQRWELDNLLAVAMVIAQAARERRESRGAHFQGRLPQAPGCLQPPYPDFHAGFRNRQPRTATREHEPLRVRG